MCGLMRCKCTLQAPAMPFNMRMHFVMPAIPALASMWPKFALPLVMMIASSPRSFMMSRRAPTSMGSPSAVPVPWHSAMVISLGVRPASTIDALMHICCDGPFGAVMLALLPSWLMLLPMTQAIISWAASSESLRSTNPPPQPSPRKKPLADSSKVKDLPVRDNIVAMQYDKKVPQLSSKQIPITSALEIRLFKLGEAWPSLGFTRVRAAWPIATSEEEQAVSTDWHGPLRSKRCASRVQQMPICHPVYSYGLTSP
mmetsp:Transcript_92223/g.265374  ORF Transcript_92223/g.265374 Transcript_92223/m.265374 type:complete len:256 (-) Transcript_92223:665-1432(-)